MLNQLAHIAAAFALVGVGAASAATIVEDVSWDGGGGLNVGWTTRANWNPETNIAPSSSSTGRGPVNGYVVGPDTYEYNVSFSNVTATPSWGGGSSSAGAWISTPTSPQINQLNIGTNAIVTFQNTLNGTRYRQLNITDNGQFTSSNTNVNINQQLELVNVSAGGTLTINHGQPTGSGDWQLVGSGGLSVTQFNFASGATIQGLGRLGFVTSQTVQGGNYNLNLRFGGTTSTTYQLGGPVTVGSYLSSPNTLFMATSSSGELFTSTLNTNSHDVTVSGSILAGQLDKRTAAGDPLNQSSYGVLNIGSSDITVGGSVSLIGDPDGRVAGTSGNLLRRDSWINAGDATLTIGGSFAENRASNRWYNVTTSGTNNVPQPGFLWDTDELALTFNGGAGPSSPALFEVMSEDRGGDGFSSADLVDNFAFESLTITANTYLRLQDAFDNYYVTRGDTPLATPLPEVLYLTSLTINPGSTLDLNGLTVYVTSSFANGGTLLESGGTLVVIPEPAGVALLAPLALMWFRRRR